MAAKEILVVEDDKVIRQLVKKLAEKRGASVTVVASGKEANQILKEKNHYDLVFLDLILPEITGWDVLETLKANPGTKATPIVILTGAALSAKEKEKILQKADAVVEKLSFTLAGFDKILDQWLLPADYET